MLEERPVPVISGDDLKALFQSVRRQELRGPTGPGSSETFLNTGARLAEMANLKVSDCDLADRGLYVVGKGRRARALPLGPKAVEDLDRYLRVRSRHKDVGLVWLWLGRRGILPTQACSDG